jgi:hypothetical protein
MAASYKKKHHHAMSKGAWAISLSISDSTCGMPKYETARKKHCG